MTQKPLKVYRTPIEVRGYELDSFGHVNHANYLHYFEFARWKMLEAEEVTLATFNQHGIWPVIASINVQYLKPTFMGDRLEVETLLLDYKRSSMQIQQTIMKNGSPVCKAEVRSVIVDKDGRPAPLPPALEPKWRLLAGQDPV